MTTSSSPMGIAALSEHVVDAGNGVQDVASESGGQPRPGGDPGSPPSSLVALAPG